MQTCEQIGKAKGIQKLSVWNQELDTQIYL